MEVRVMWPDTCARSWWVRSSTRSSPPMPHTGESHVACPCVHVQDPDESTSSPHKGAPINPFNLARNLLRCADVETLLLEFSRDGHRRRRNHYHSQNYGILYSYLPPPPLNCITLFIFQDFIAYGHMIDGLKGFLCRLIMLWRYFTVVDFFLNSQFDSGVSGKVNALVSARF